MAKAKGLFIVGTDTAVGKTFVTCGLTLCLKEKMSLGVMKPIASGCQVQDNFLVNEDASALSQVLGIPMTESINPIRFEEPLTPSVASVRSGMPCELNVVEKHFRLLQAQYDFLLVEGVGGLLVPLNQNETVLDLIQLIGFPVLVVGRTGLGTINHTLMTCQILKQNKIPIKGFILNGLSQEPTTAELTNPDEISRLTGLACLGVLPQLLDFSLEKASFDDLKKIFEERVDIDRLLHG